MLNTWLLVIKTIVIVSTIKSVYSWNPQCSPCRCFDQKNKKMSDCSSSTTTLQLTKIPDLRIETEIVFLVGQQLRYIPEDAFFKGVKNSLKFVDLKNCKVRSVHANAFRNLEYLSGLDLSHNELSQLEENIFGLNNKLSTIILQYNNLKVLPENIFHNLPLLKYLDISKNNLHYIYPNQFKTNINLERLILQSNYLTKFDHTLISNLPKLNVLYLDNNPWTCDCHTKDLLKLIIDRHIDFIYKDNYPSCSKPKQWKGKQWLDIKPRDFCSVQNTLSVNVTEGDNFFVDCTLENTNNVVVEWFLNGQTLNINNPKKYQVSSVTDNPNTLYKLKINNLEFSDMGVYKCWSRNLKDSDVQYEETIVNIQPGIKPIITGPENQKKLVKNGETDYTLSCDIIGSLTPKVEWLLDGKVLTFSESNCKRQQSSDNSLLIPRINPFCFGNYTCRATNTKGVAEKNYELIALPQRKPKVDPVSNIDNNSAYEGTSVSLNCFVSEDIELVVQWLRNGQIISPNDKYSIRVDQIDATTYNYILTIKEISFSQAGNYKCRANTVESPDYTINVKPGNEPIIEDFNNNNEITLETGENKDIPCKASGVPKPTITWQLPPNCNEDSYTEDETLHLINVDCPGRYKCIVTNAKGKTEKEFKLTIATPKISTTSIKTDYSDGKIFEYDDITLNCLVEGSITSQPYWIFNNKPITVNNKKYKIETIAIPPSKTSFYYNLQIKNISRLEQGNYKCRLGLDYKSVIVEVQPAKPPTIDQITDPEQYVEEGTKYFKLECNVSGPHLTVLWTSNNLCKYDQTVEDNDDYKTSLLVIKEVHRSCNGQYICSANNKIGHVDKVVNLNVVKPEPLKTVIESNNNNEALENKDVILKCLIRGAVTSEPTWKFNRKFDSSKHQIVKQEISKTSYWYNLVIKNLKPEDAGTYRCVLGNFEQTVSVIVKPNIRPNIEYVPNTQTIEAGLKNFQITCKVSGSPIPETKWLKTGNFDGCRHEITKLVSGNSVWIHLTIFEVTAACSGRYTCIATSSKEIETKEVDISVISIDRPPIMDIETLSIDSQVIKNENVTLKCFIKTRVFEPEWVHEGRVIRPSNKYKIEKVPVNQTSYWFNLVIFKISANDKGSYKCRVNNFESETTIGVQESKKPVIEYISIPNAVEKGVKNVILSCKVDGIPKPKVHWYYEGHQINKISSNQFSCKYSLSSDVNNNDYTEWLYLTIKDVEPSCAGKYKCSAENFKGSEKHEINLSVVTVEPPEIIEPPKHILENDNVTLYCRITGSINSKPNWIHNNIPIELNRSDKYKLVMIPIDLTSYWYNLEIINISPHDKGNYKCKINNFETEILLETERGSKPDIIEITSKEMDIEEGKKEVTLTCEVSGNPRPDILWLYENIPIDKNINSNCLYKVTNPENKLRILSEVIIQHVIPSCAGKYKCVAKNSKGTTERDINVRVLTRPKVEVQPISGNQALENEAVSLKCLVPSERYSAEWFRENEPVIIEANGRYSITFEPINETAYWHNLVISDLLLSDKGEYKCKINNLESTIELDVQKSVKPTIEYMPTKDIIVTEGSKNVRLACKATGVPKPSVSWQHEPTQQSQNNCKHTITSEGNESSEWLYLTIAQVTPSCSGIYKCVSRNSAGIDQKYNILSVTSLKQTPQITITTTSPDGIIRDTDNVTLRCLSSGNINSKVQWYHNNNPIDFGDKDKYSVDIQEVNQLTKWNIVTIKNVNLKDTGDYSCKVNNAEQSYHLEVERKLIPTVEYLSNSKLIIDENTEETVLPCKVTDLGDYVVDWTFNGRSIDESSCTTDIIYGKTRHFEWHNLTILNIKASCSGQYKCIIRNLENNYNNAVDLTVLPVRLPEINVSSSSADGNIREQDSVTLKCLITSSNSNAAKWLYQGQILTSDNKHKITKLFINDTTYWYNLEIPNVSIQQSGDYKCNIVKLETVTTLNVRPGSKPIIEYISNTEIIVEEGINKLTLFCKATGSPVPSIKWSHQTKTSVKRGDCKLESRFDYHSNSQLNYLTITNIKPSCSGKIICDAINSKGYVNKIINLTVIPNQKAEITVKSTIPDTIREGDNVTLSCLVTGKNTGPVEWYFNDKYGGKIKGNFKVNTYEINPLTYQYDYVITNITLDQAGRYYCGRTENFVDIKVQRGTVPTVEQFPNENIVIYSDSKDSTLFCKVSGVPKPNAIWLYNKKPLDTSKCKYELSSNDQWYNLTIIDASTSCNGNYKCVVRNLRGTTEQETKLQVIEPLKPDLKVITNSTDGIIKENDKVTLTCLVKGDFNILVMWVHNNNYIKQDKNHKIIKIKHDDISFWYNLEIENISLNQAGNYECKTLKSRSVINLKVQSTTKPTVTLSPMSKIFVPSGTKELILSCTETGMPIPSGTWEYNDIKVDSISACLNNCQYKLRSATNSDIGTRWVYLTLSNITTACSGKYKCTAENTKGKAEKFVEIVVTEQPTIQIQEPIHADLSKDVTLQCQVTSVATPLIIWKYYNKQVNPSTRHKITNYKGANNFYYSNLTISNFQQTDFGDYTCEGKLHIIQNVKTVSLKVKAKFSPEFDNPINMLENFKIINTDVIFTTKVRGFPPPYLIWEIDDIIITPDKSLNGNTKYLAEISYINDDQYWFNQTVKNFNCTDIARHVFTVKNEIGEAKKAFFIDKVKSDKSETFSILTDDPIVYNNQPFNPV